MTSLRISRCDIRAAGIDQTEQVIRLADLRAHAFNQKSLQTKFGADAATIVKAVKLATDREPSHRRSAQRHVTNNFISPLTWYKGRGGQRLPIRQGNGSSRRPVDHGF